MANMLYGPIIMLLGPSGSGKTTLAKWLAEDFQFLHLDNDKWHERTDIDSEGLQEQWKHFYEGGHVDKLAAAIYKHVSKSRKRGAVLSFPSDVFLSINHILEAERFGIRTLVLYGPREKCLQAFLNREGITGRKLDETHWEKHNEKFYLYYNRSSLVPYRLEIFKAGIYRLDRTELLSKVQNRVACKQRNIFAVTHPWSILKRST
jgi:hypothetical protein